MNVKTEGVSIERIEAAISKLEMRLAQIPIDEQTDDNPEPKKIRGLIHAFNKFKPNLEIVANALVSLRC